MKYLPLVTAALLGFLISSIANDIRVSNMFWNWKIEKTINNSLENIENLKQDCEKSLPRDQECTLLYEFVPTKTKGEQ